MTRTITVGEGSGGTTRDYTTLGAFVADVGVGLPAGPAAESDPWEVLCYNDNGTAIQETGEVTVTDLFWDGATNNSSTTYNCVIQPASGTGANGDPNDHRTRSGPLDYDPSVGVAFEWSDFHRGFNDASQTPRAPFLDVVGIQFYHSAVRRGTSLYQRIRSNESITNQCIFKVSPFADRGSADEWTSWICRASATNANFVFKNNLIIMSGDADHLPAVDAVGLDLQFFNGQTFNNTIVNELHSTEKQMIGAQSTSQVKSTAVFANNLILGFEISWNNDGDNDGTQEYTVTDASSANTDGSNNFTSITLADQLESITLGALNARLKPGSDAIGGAGGSYIASDDIFGKTRNAPEDVGCAEFLRLVGNGLIAGNKLQRGKLVQ